MAKKHNPLDNFGDKLRSNTLDKQTPERRKEIASLGGKAKKIESILKDIAANTEGLAETQSAMLEAAKELYIKKAYEDAMEGDFKKLEFWERATGNNKHIPQETDTASKDGKLDINITITGDTDKVSNNNGAKPKD